MSSLVLAIHQYFTKLRGIRIKKSFLDQVIPIFDTTKSLDLSNTEDNFLLFSKGRSKVEQNQNLDNIESNLSIDEVLVPDKLLAFSFILNPIRLAILRILYEFHNYVSSEMRKTLNVSWGAYTSHLSALLEEGLIFSQDEFIEAKTLKVLYLEEKGRKGYLGLKNVLQEIMI